MFPWEMMICLEMVLPVKVDSMYLIYVVYQILSSSRSPKRRKLSDTELDSGDDEGRRDRAGEEIEDEEQEQTLRVIDYELDRHGIPLGGDGEVGDYRVRGSELILQVLPTSLSTIHWDRFGGLCGWSIQETSYVASWSTTFISLLCIASRELHN